VASPLTTRDAELHIASMNSRNRKSVPTFMASRFPPVYIFNIYSKSHRRQGYAGGEYVIPPCESGQPYSKPCIINGFIADEYDLGDGQGNMSWNAEEGENVAKDVVGIGSTSPELSSMTTNLEWWGVFIAKNQNPTAEEQKDLAIAKGEKPTKWELAQAKSKLDRLMARILSDGDRIAPFQNDPKSEKLTQIHFDAAAYLKQPRNWANPVMAMQDCPGCGEPVKIGIAKCGHCGAILDRVKAMELGLIPDETVPVKGKQ